MHFKMLTSQIDNLFNLTFGINILKLLFSLLDQLGWELKTNLTLSKLNLSHLTLINLI
jgi:hypothetical protein